MPVIKAEELREVCNKMLEEYGDEARTALAEACKKTGKQAVKKLKKGGGYSDDGSTGYTKGWGTTIEEKRGGILVTVHNKKAPGLAHLLEFGHAKQNGGRTRAFPHIAPVSEAVDQDFMEIFQKEMSK